MLLYELQNITINGRIITKGDKPVVETGEALKSEVAEVSIDGNDIAGTVRFNTGLLAKLENTISKGNQVEVTFSKPYTATARVALTPVNEASAMVRYFVERSETGLIIKFVDAPP